MTPARLHLPAGNNDRSPGSAPLRSAPHRTKAAFKLAVLAPVEGGRTGLRQARVQGTLITGSNTVRGLSALLYTVGYEGLSLAEFLNRLAQAGVSRLVDVRELPLSRRPGFSKTKLAAALRELGIEYVHARPLGNPKPNRERYWAGDVEGGAEVYRQHLHDHSYRALKELADGLDEEPTCLMCFERDHEHCHRAVIVKSLADLRPDVLVEHL